MSKLISLFMLCSFMHVMPSQANTQTSWPILSTRSAYHCNFWRSSGANYGDYVCSGYPSLEMSLEDRSVERLLETMKTRIEELEARVKTLEGQNVL